MGHVDKSKGNKERGFAINAACNKPKVFARDIFSKFYPSPALRAPSPFNGEGNKCAGSWHVEGVKFNNGNNLDVIPNLIRNLSNNEMLNQVQHDNNSAGLRHVDGVKHNECMSLRGTTVTKQSHKDLQNSTPPSAFTLSCKSFALTKSLLPLLRDCRKVCSLTGFASHHPSAFTLAETLIALVIIGIVAAITVPTIVARQREQATVEKVKKFYSTMNNALKLAITETGLSPAEWDCGTTATRDSSVKLMSYLKPHLVIISDDCQNTGECRSDVVTKYLNGNDNATYYRNNNFYKAVLNDGSVFWIVHYLSGTSTAMIYYDINGTNAPNVWGKDTFLFHIQGNKVVPRTNDDCNKSANGLGCAKYILSKGNMDYLH